MSTVRLQREMSYDEAAKVLGFKRGDVIAPLLPAFRRAEEKLAELIASTDNEEHYNMKIMNLERNAAAYGLLSK